MFFESILQILKFRMRKKIAFSAMTKFLFCNIFKYYPLPSIILELITIII